MKATWALQDAKSKFSKVVDMTLREGPQVVTRRGTPVVVVVSVGDYEKRQRPKKESLADFIMRTIPVRVDLDITRSKDTGRDIEL